MTRKDFLPFSPPCLDEDEIQEVVDSLRSGWLTTGPKTRRFEAEFATAVAADSALAVSSGTAALHTALVALGIGEGDEVITSTMTFCSTVHVIEQVGARPILVDIEPDTMNLDPELVAAAVTPRTRAIMPVHYGGHPCEMDTIQAVAEQHGLDVVEDAAHALPAKYRGRWIGSGRNLVAFSFYATKNLTTGEGGMLTGPVDLLAKAKVLRLHGMDHDAWKRYDKGGNWRYDVVAPGFKYNLTDLQSAIGLHQLRKLPRFAERRRQVVTAYHSGLTELGICQLPVERPEVEHAWHLYPIRLHLDRLAIDRDGFLAEMHQHNIGTSVHFIPIHLLAYYREKYGYRPEDFPVALDCFQRLITLPLNPGLQAVDVEDVLQAVREVAETHCRQD
ncbi:MAG: DegT/DnrJ/EryC1/StrS aminotransferase family protein [bacterium]